jgi:hypothetical protein
MADDGPIRDVRREVDLAKAVDPPLPNCKAEVAVFIDESYFTAYQADENPGTASPGGLKSDK